MMDNEFMDDDEDLDLAHLLNVYSELKIMMVSVMISRCSVC